MSQLELYRDDLLNRYAGHTFLETVVGSMTLVEFRDAGLTVIEASQKLVAGDAYQNIRFNLVGDTGILPRLTTTQRDALTATTDATNILNITTDSIEKFESAAWVPTLEVIAGNYSFQGDTKFGGDAGTAPVGRISVIGDDFGSTRVRTLSYSDTAEEGAAVQVGHSRGTEASTEALDDGDRLGQFIFVGSNGTQPASNGPVIRGFATEDWGGSAKGSRIDFLTIADGTTTQVLALRVSENGFPVHPSFTVATLPTSEAGGCIYVSDETGGATLAFGDGTNWLRVQDRAIVA